MNIISYNSGKNLKIDKKETLRYLGYHFGGDVPLDEELDKMIDDLTKKMLDVITPRCAYEIYQLDVADDVCHLSQFSLNKDNVPSDIEHLSSTLSAKFLLSIHSAKLSAHIRECKLAILFAATIGPGADMLIRRFNGRSTIKPAILQAVGAAAIEAFADEVTEQINDEVKLYLGNDSLRFKMRFSPGYGDFSLEHQTDFFRLLSLEKNLGMSLNSALLMSPSKSITAVIGVL